MDRRTRDFRLTDVAMRGAGSHGGGVYLAPAPGEGTRRSVAHAAQGTLTPDERMARGPQRPSVGLDTSSVPTGRGCGHKGAAVPKTHAEAAAQKGKGKKGKTVTESHFQPYDAPARTPWRQTGTGSASSSQGPQQPYRRPTEALWLYSAAHAGNRCRYCLKYGHRHANCYTAWADYPDPGDWYNLNE